MFLGQSKKVVHLIPHIMIGFIVWNWRIACHDSVLRREKLEKLEGLWKGANDRPFSYSTEILDEAISLHTWYKSDDFSNVHNGDWSSNATNRACRMKTYETFLDPVSLPKTQVYWDVNHKILCNGRTKQRWFRIWISSFYFT